jgi:putative acetyltransferase
MNGVFPGGECMQIRVDDLRSAAVADLLRAHLENSKLWSPPQSIHALDVGALRAPEVTFWTAWDGAMLLGCGAMKELDAAHGEIKSMHTAHRHRRRGVASAILAHLIDEARLRNYRRLSLETGSMAAYAAARALYTRFGFSVCSPFADYVADTNSVFMTRQLGCQATPNPGVHQQRGEPDSR